MPTSSFNPDAATTDAILQSIAADYSLSLTDIASQHNSTIEALTAWLTRDDIDERLTAIESACARRARLTAANHLPAVAHVAKQALEEASDVLRLPPDYRTQHSIALRIRATESARKAAALLLRIANFTPGPRRIRHHDALTTPRVTPPQAPITAPHTESAQSAPTAAAPTESAHPVPADATRTESTLPASCAAPRTESSPAAPVVAPRTESTPTAPTDNVATDRALSAPAAELPINRVQSATICDPQSQIAPKTSPSAPPTNRAQSAPFSPPPAESTPAEPISSTSAACSTSALLAAPPRHASNSHAIPAWFTLVKPSAVPAPRWPPAPQSHPPPRKPTAATTRASFTPV